MESAGPTRIRARTRRQTMDWALVLASQGIGATIDDGADGAGWGLIVSASDYAAAVRAIELYRRENRHWHWRRPLPWRGLLFDWKIIFWGLLLILFYGFTQSCRPDFQITGRMDNAAVNAGEWWRIFTAMLLHADVAHLAANVSLGLVLLGLAMGRYGTMGLLAAYLAGAAGNVAGLWLYPESHRSLGASGMVMGGLGLLAAQSVLVFRHHPFGGKPVIKGVVAGVMLFVLFGLSPGTDIVAHLGGFIAGLLLGGSLLLSIKRWQNPRTELAAGIIFAGWLISTGWLALR